MFHFFKIKKKIISYINNKFKEIITLNYNNKYKKIYNFIFSKLIIPNIKKNNAKTICKKPDPILYIFFSFLFLPLILYVILSLRHSLTYFLNIVFSSSLYISKKSFL